MTRWWRRLPLGLAITALCAVSMVAAAALALLLARWWAPWAATIAACAVLILPLAYQVRRTLAPARSLFRALAGSVASYRDGDFNFSVTWEGGGELAELVASHDRLGQVLRKRNKALVQRELLLDTLVQNAPMATLLVDSSRRIVLGNVAARKLFGDGRKLEGRSLDELMERAPEAMREAMAKNGDGMFCIRSNDEEDFYHLSRRRFRLNGRPHELLLLRQLTAELRRQEVQTWKKVLRVISHELNNSLAPIASLAHSGIEMLRRGQYERLPTALETIEERARHLDRFLLEYAQFAKLPAPRVDQVEWPGFIRRLRNQVKFEFDDAALQGHGRFDAAQIEQCLINLLRNAHESASPATQVRLALHRLPGAWRIDVLDRGSGMSESVLANALLPFYSTKHSGTGLGLALAREICEAHGGRISLQNREGGGLQVSLTLPA